MPNVPLYKPQAREQGFPNQRFNVDAPIEAFNGGPSAAGVVDAAQGALNAVDKIFQEEKQKADELAVSDAYARTVQLKNRLVYDPNEGAILRKGKDALGVADEYGKRFDKDTDEILNGLTNDQRHLYRKMREQQKTDLLGDLERHTSNEYLRFQDETLKYGIATAQDDAILSYGRVANAVEAKQGWSQSVVNQKLAEQKAFILSHAARNKGLSGEAIKAQLSAAYSQTHSKIIENLLENGSDLVAQRYFEANKAQITDGETLSSITKRLKNDSLLGEAQRKADAIFVTSKGDLERADAKAQEIQDPRLREKVQFMVRQKAEFQKNVVEAKRTEASKVIYNHIIQGGSVNDPKIQGPLNSLPPSDQENYRGLEEKRRNKELEKTSTPLFYSLRMKLADPTGGDEYARKLNLITEYGTQLTPEHLNELARHQATVVGKKDRSELDSIFGRSKAVEDSLQNLYIKDEASQSRVRREVEAWFTAETKRTGKQPDSAAVTAVADKLARKALAEGRAKQTFDRPKETTFSQDNEDIVRLQIASLVKGNAKKRDVLPDEIVGAVRRSWETAKEAGTELSNDQLRSTTDMYTKRYLLEKRVGLFGIDSLAKDKAKLGYQITIEDVPQALQDSIRSQLVKKRLPAGPKQILHYYVKDLFIKGKFEE